MAPLLRSPLLQILLLIASFRCLLAARQNVNQDLSLKVKRSLSFTETHLRLVSNAISKTVPPAAYNFVHRVVPRQCQAMYFAEFVHDLTKGQLDAALDLSYAQTPAANESLIEEDDGIDAEEWPACKPGALVIDCARTLKPALWLQQQWALADRLELHKNAWYCPWCRTKDENFNQKAVEARHQLFSGAVAAAGYDEEASQSICEKEVSSYNKMEVRECMLMRASQLHLADNKKQAKLVEKLSEYWSHKDSEIRKQLVKSSDSAWDQAKGLVSDAFGARSSVDHWRTKFFSRLDLGTLGFDYSKEKKACVPMVAKAQAIEALDRLTEEVTSVCDKEKGCQETSGTYCPEGTSCDCQRPHTPKRALTVFNAVFWVISPLTVAVGAGTAAFFTGGAAAVPAAVWTAGWFPDYIPAIIAMAATSRKWTAECMCFEMTCGHDADKGVCALKRTDTVKNSSNPYDWLPSNGLKCARKPGSENTCELQKCSITDVQIKQGEGFFGRLGYDGADLYNCANLKGSVDSQLAFQRWLPDGGEHGGTVKNSAQARKSFYDRFGTTF